MISTTELVKALIDSHHGWAVADQFEDTFDPSGYGDFSKQNYNALRYIHETVDGLIKSGLLSQNVTDELQEYHDRLKAYFWDSGEEGEY